MSASTPEPQHTDQFGGGGLFDRSSGIVNQAEVQPRERRPMEPIWQVGPKQQHQPLYAAEAAALVRQAICRTVLEKCESQFGFRFVPRQPEAADPGKNSRPRNRPQPRKAGALNGWAVKTRTRAVPFRGCCSNRNSPKHEARRKFNYLDQTKSEPHISGK